MSLKRQEKKLILSFVLRFDLKFCQGRSRVVIDLGLIWPLDEGNTLLRSLPKVYIMRSFHFLHRLFLGLYEHVITKA